MRADRTFNANGLELRVPFLDKDLVKYVMNLKGKYKLPKNGIEKHLLRECVKDRFIELTYSRVLLRKIAKFTNIFITLKLLKDLPIYNIGDVMVRCYSICSENIVLSITKINYNYCIKHLLNKRLKVYL